MKTTIKKTISVDTVRINIKGKQHDLTLDEVKSLKAELEKAFPEPKIPTWNPPVIIRDQTPRWDPGKIWCDTGTNSGLRLNHQSTAADNMKL